MYIELSKDLEQELINFYLIPHTIAETMKKYSVGREKIKNILKAHNIPEHSKEIVNTIKQNNFTSEQVQEIIKFYLMPNTLQDTVEKFNIGRFALKNLLKRNNVVEHSREILELLKFNRLINGREQEIIEFYLQPNSIEKTAIAFNLGRPAVISLLSKNNIEIRDDSRKIIFTEEQEKEIIKFYSTPNSLRETCRHFNIKNRDVIKNILIKYDIPFHSKETCMKLKQEKATKTNLERYGVANTYQLPEIREKAQKAWKDNEQEIRKKMQQTSLERHGDPFYHNQEQANKTRLEKYGVINFFQIKEIHEKALERNHSPEVLEKKRQTCQEHFGTDTPLESKEVWEKINKTVKEKYGVDYITQNSEIQNKIKQTNLEKYVETSYTKTEEYKERVKQTNLERYGAISSLANKEIIEKGNQTLIAKYGVDNSLKVPEIKEKIKNTNLKKYGVENPMQSEIVKAKMKQTNLARYGFENPLASPEIRAKARQTLVEHYGTNHAPIQKYFYQDDFFDSFPELCFYLYHIKNNIKIIREPIELNYAFEGRLYHYYPDFKVGDSIYEIKGDQFLAEDGTWCCPYDRSKDEQFELKHKCALENNIVILYEKDYLKYIY